MGRIKALFFDLDETLIENQLSVRDVFRQVYIDFSHRLGEENESVFFDELRRRILRLWSTMFDCHIRPERQLVTCFELSIRATKAVPNSQQLKLAQEMLDRFLILSTNNVQFQDKAEWVLEKLNRLGYVTGIITNGLEAVQMGKIKKLELLEKVDCVTISAQARAHKPFAPVFKLALERANVCATESCMIGDHPTNDVAGGIRAGFKGVYYNPKNISVARAFANINETPDHVITKLTEAITLPNRHSQQA